MANVCYENVNETVVVVVQVGIAIHEQLEIRIDRISSADQFHQKCSPVFLRARILTLSGAAPISSSPWRAADSG